MFGVMRPSQGAGFGGVVPAKLQALFTGFPMPPIAGGGQIVPDYMGVLQKVNVGIPAIVGGRFISASAGFTDSLADGTPLQPFRMVRTKNGTVKEYLDLPTVQRSTVYTLGVQRAAVADDGTTRYYTCTTAGTTAVGAPVFPTSATVVDGTVVWTYSGYATINFKRYLGEPARTNLFLNSTAPVTQNITTTAQAYTVSVLGTGTVTLSGTATGVASAGSPLTVTATAGTLTCTVAGSLTKVQVEAGSFATSWIDTAGASITRAATVYSRSSANVLRNQNCAIWGEVVPSATGQSGNLFGSVVTGGAANSIDVELVPTSVRLRKYVEGAVASATVNYTHESNIPFQYQGVWSDKGLAIRTRSLVGDGWSIWSAWATNISTTPSPIAEIVQIGSRTNVGQIAGNFQDFKTLFVPGKTSLAEYQAYVESERNWGIK